MFIHSFFFSVSVMLSQALNFSLIEKWNCFFWKFTQGSVQMKLYVLKCRIIPNANLLMVVFWGSPVILTIEYINRKDKISTFVHLSWSKELVWLYLLKVYFTRRFGMWAGMYGTLKHFWRNYFCAILCKNN